MKPGPWQWLKRLPALLEAPRPEPAEHAQRILVLQRNIVLPARLVVLAAVFFSLYNSRWLGAVVTEYGVLVETLQTILTGCALVMLAGTALFYVVRKFPSGAVQWVVFAVGIADGLFLAGLTTLDRGFESVLYWGFPALIVVNAISIPLATPQIVLNLLLGIFFLCAGLLESGTQRELTLPALKHHARRKVAPEDIEDPRAVARWLSQAPKPARKFLWDAMTEEDRKKIEGGLAATNSPDETRYVLATNLNGFFSPLRYFPDAQPAGDPLEIKTDANVLRVAVLLLLTFCCYGLQWLRALDRRKADERQEFLFRTEQLRSAGRLAAEVAHQIKNPLAIINNAVFSLQRAGKGGPPEASEPLRIIREEVAKADRIITQIMGYAQLSEGRVEKLDMIAELDRAVEQVFPRAITTGVEIHRDYAAEFPPLLMQPRHFSESVVNLLQNARDALAGNSGGELKGHVSVTAVCLPDYSVQITVTDDGPGIAPDQQERIFEAYHTTKEHGTGLGLAMVKHNAELYGGTVRVESALGRGAKFVLVFPAKTLIDLGK
ncbi:MAG: HAMP domain-containing histidine kinase [Pedosphaera sp.]|nr:HAMP domain-containing histidine kinase [Pedosphaera sp.]